MSSEKQQKQLDPEQGFRRTENNVSSLEIANADLLRRNKTNVDERISELMAQQAGDPESGEEGQLLPEEEQELVALTDMSDGLNKLLRKRLFNVDEPMTGAQMRQVKSMLMASHDDSVLSEGEFDIEKAAYEIPWKDTGLGDVREVPEEGQINSKEDEQEIALPFDAKGVRKIPRVTVNPRSGPGSSTDKYREGHGTIDEPIQIIPNKMGSLRTRAEVIIYTPKGVYGLRRGKNWLAFPGGGLEDGETPEDAARRECVEEADLNIRDLVAKGHTDNKIPKEHRGGKGRNHDRSRSHLFVAESAGKMKTKHKDRERFHIYDFDRAIEILNNAIGDPEAKSFKAMNQKRVDAVREAKRSA